MGLRTAGILIRAILLVAALTIFIPAAAQNTKGDQPSKPTRETRFKGKSKKTKTKRVGKRISPLGKSQATSAQKGPGESKAWSGDITGRKIPATRSKSRKVKNIHKQGGRTVKSTYGKQADKPFTGAGYSKRIKPRSYTGQTRNVYPQSGPYVKKKTPPRKDDTHYKASKAGGYGKTRIQSSSGKVKNVFPAKGPYVKKTRPPTSDDKPFKYKNGTTGRIKIQSASGKIRNVYPQKGPYVAKKKKPGKDDSPYRGKGVSGFVVKPRSVSGKVKTLQVSKGGPGKARSATGQVKNVFPKKGPFVNNPSADPSKTDRPPRRKKKITPASATKPFLRKTSINPYAGFWNKKQKGEKAYEGDISGRKLRTKNYITPRPEVIEPSGMPYVKLRRIGDIPYSGKAAGKYKTATKTGQAWQGDISGRKVRYKNFSSKDKSESVGGGLFKTPIFGTKKPGTFTGTSKAKRRTPTDVSGVPGKKYLGVGMRRQGVDYGGFQKSRKPLLGGGSVSGKLWNNKGQPLPGKGPRSSSALSGYPGSVKAKKFQPDTDAGGIPGKFRAFKGFRNQGENYTGNYRMGKGFQKQGEDFTGNIKFKRPLKGGGSVSGKLWNNKEQPIAGRSPKNTAMGTYQGSIKARKKEPGKEAGEFTGGYRLFELKPSFRNQGEEFTGYVKAKKPLKGGGSVSGELWNNNEKPIVGKGPRGDAAAMANYQGNINVKKKEPSKEVGGIPGKFRQQDLSPGMGNQGEEFTGYIKRPLLRNDYVRNDLSAKEALKKSKPDKSTYLVDGLQVRVKQQNYVHNKSSADEALKVHQTGKAYARSVDYQGNIKMKKFELFGKRDLHPDAQFVKTNKNNVREERGLITNFKLLWGRLFRKNETQPDHLKEKLRKPRYDKGEIGLWND